MRHRLNRAVCLLLLLCAALQARAARVGLVVGEPFGNFGTMMPQGHTGVYLADFCADGPVHLRPCAPGEAGVVLSRYHDLRHPALDWMAVPLTPFLYGVEDAGTVPPTMDATLERELREQYRQAHLLAVVPDRIDRHGRSRRPAYGDWEEGIGAAFDRRVLLYTFDVPDEVERAIAAKLNGEPNTRRYTLGRENCADFAAELLSLALPPGVLGRSVLADFDMTTPKNLARELDSYGRSHPERHLQVFAIPQIAGSLRRSRPLRGAAETFVAQKRYVLALSVLQPEALLACLWAYEAKGKYPAGYDAIPLQPDEMARFVKPHAETDSGVIAARLPSPPAPVPPLTQSVSGQSSTN
jgi:hypothetical protein